MKILFHFTHPAHFHLFKNVIKKLNNNQHTVFIIIKKKDVLEELLKSSGFKYYNVLPKGRKDNKLSIAFGLFAQSFRLLTFCLKHKPDILLGTSTPISPVGKILSIPSVNFNEDDASVVPIYAKLAYPWASQILAPSVCDVGKWNNKKISYDGYHELAYLHPNNFKANIKTAGKYIDVSKPYFILRFVKLGAHHDTGISGISNAIALNLVEILKSYGNVYITSERTLNDELEPFRIQINPVDMHHVMAFADLFIGDSQTMAAEAGVLGTPFVRFNDFVGRISYLKELEEKYQLGIGIKTNREDQLYEKVKELVANPNLKKLYQSRKDKMLLEKIDYSAFLFWFIENYPSSVVEYRIKPNIQYDFIGLRKS